MPPRPSRLCRYNPALAVSPFARLAFLPLAAVPWRCVVSHLRRQHRDPILPSRPFAVTCVLRRLAQQYEPVMSRLARCSPFILAPPSSRDIWINPLSIIQGANPAHVAHAHIAHARARHRRARGSAIIRLDDRAPDPGQTIPADGISLLSIIHNRAFGMGSVNQ